MVEVVFESLERTQNLVAVLFENLDPHSGVAGGDASGVFQAVAGEVTPFGGALVEKSAEIGGDDLGQVADVGDDFVVLVGADGHDLGSEISPEADHGFDGYVVVVFGGGDKTGAAIEEFSITIFPAGFLAAGHGMGTDEGSSGG